MDIIFIHGLSVATTIGVFEWEKKIKQKLVFDIELAKDLSPAGNSDALNDTLDYKQIGEFVTDFVANSQFQLLESLGETIASQLQDKFNIPWLKLKITKPAVLKNATAVGIIIERGEK